MGFDDRLELSRKHKVQQCWGWHKAWADRCTQRGLTFSMTAMWNQNVKTLFRNKGFSYSQGPQICDKLRSQTLQ